MNLIAATRFPLLNVCINPVTTRSRFYREGQPSSIGLLMQSVQPSGPRVVIANFVNLVLGNEFRRDRMQAAGPTVHPDSGIVAETGVTLTIKSTRTTPVAFSQRSCCAVSFIAQRLLALFPHYLVVGFYQGSVPIC